MSFRGKFLLVVFSATLALYTVVGGWMSIGSAQQQQNDPGAQLRIFESVLQHIQQDYVDEPDLNKVRAGALRGLAYGLDPYSTYLTTEQVREFRAGAANTQASIGAELSQVASYLYVIAPVKGGPAAEAGALDRSRYHFRRRRHSPRRCPVIDRVARLPKDRESLAAQRRGRMQVVDLVEVHENQWQVEGQTVARSRGESGPPFVHQTQRAWDVDLEVGVDLAKIDERRSLVDRCKSLIERQVAQRPRSEHERKDRRRAFFPWITGQERVIDRKKG